jgi:coproporphyrinogen III oxidase
VSYSDKMRQWQLLRRGRYLEFNLLYDRGVKFGLASVNPRVEGIMVSAPPLIAFEYNHVIEEGSEEAKLMEVLKTPRDWVD